MAAQVITFPVCQGDGAVRRHALADMLCRLDVIECWPHRVSRGQRQVNRFPAQAAKTALRFVKSLPDFSLARHPTIMPQVHAALQI